ncbi:ABC transporter permease [Microbacterium pseudoresistens]|uniref:NitT/TauT family transport system permease protein n=1 Tax=Microbacterium pseudoresistens TaxID=640634 RepID=A0A7Y9JMC0_9MICO|nr:ABC transporter permease [Microbacterium pseudoresistens]NYD53871.1 NitT/TauT family transport system permease protein [Microbacterium pseudoresistens]
MTSATATIVTQNAPAELARAIEGSQQRAKRKKTKWSALTVALQVLSLVVALGMWEWAAASGSINTLFFSQPSAIGTFAIANAEGLWNDTLATLRATVFGFAIGSVAGVAVAFFITSIPLLDRVLQPWISVLMSIPRVALAPLFLLWFGITETSKVALAVSIVFFMVLVSTAAGLKSVAPDLLALGKAFHASPWQRFRTILLPSCVPSIFAGLRLGVVTAILGVVSSEMVASSNGLGQRIVLYGQNFQSAGVFAVLALLAIITGVMTALVAWSERYLLRWQAM